MKEKAIIKSQHFNLKLYQKVLVGIPMGMILLGFILYLCNCGGSRGPNYHGEYWSIIDNMGDPFSFEPGLLIDLGLILLVAFVVLAWWLSSYELTVTDKRIYGTTSFGKRVDLPVDSISAVATSPFMGLVAATSSGKIAFNFMKNRDEVYTAINQLIIERQSHNNNYQADATASTTDELMKYKELLDSGIISKEEFDAKKKQLLGL